MSRGEGQSVARSRPSYPPSRVFVCQRFSRKEAAAHHAASGHRYQKQTTRLEKYKAKLGDAVAAHKSLKQHAEQLAKENAKLQKALAGAQDRGGKKVAELKEAAKLDQQAKQHLAASFQGQLEESQERVRVLQSQVEAFRMQQNTMDDREEQIKVLQSQVEALRLAASGDGSGPDQETVTLRVQCDKMQG